MSDVRLPEQNSASVDKERAQAVGGLSRSVSVPGRSAAGNRGACVTSRIRQTEGKQTATAASVRTEEGRVDDYKCARGQP